MAYYDDFVADYKREQREWADAEAKERVYREYLRKKREDRR